MRMISINYLFLFLFFLIFFCAISFLNCNEEDENINVMPQDEDKDSFENPTIETATNNNTQYDYSTTDASFDNIEDDNKDNNISNKANTDDKKPQVILPEAQVILPIRRKDSSQAVLNVSPCGGIVKRNSDTLTNRGSNVHLIWETINPSPGGNCTVKLSPGLDKDENFVQLSPINTIIDKKGHFPCGRVKGFESEIFSLPEDYVCDKCTLQWSWITPVGTFYSCSDIIINGNKIEDCLARCQNGGACFNGKCLCNDDFYGEFCQKNKNDNEGYGWILVILVVLIIIGGKAYYFLTDKPTPTWLTKKSSPIENQFIEKNQNPNQLP